MGSWGTAIFANDDAADVRADWRDGILEGRDGEDLTRWLIRSHSRGLWGRHERGLFWIALAAAQMETGRLAPDVRRKALRYLSKGGDLAEWEGPDRRRREVVLERLEEKLKGPQPAPKRLRRTKPLGVAFDVGDAVLLRNPETGAEELFVVVALAQGYPKGVVDPVLEQLLWSGGDLPTVDEMATMPCLHSIDDHAGRPNWVRPVMITVITARKDQRFGPHLGEVVARGVPRPPAGDHRDGSAWSGQVLGRGTTWPNLASRVGSPWFARQAQITRRHFGLSGAQ